MNRAAIVSGDTSLGIELGSTRIKACLVDRCGSVLATGSHTWESTCMDGNWTYTLHEVWAGVQSAYAALLEDSDRRHGVRPHQLGAIGVSAMMHGYLAFDAEGDLLVPFRTWRNTGTRASAETLSELLGVNIPLRWSIAHLEHAVQNREEHVARLDHITTLAGYVHWRLTGAKIVGVGDASGMFPVDPATNDYDTELAGRFDEHVGSAIPPVRDLLPQVRVAGETAGTLTAAGAALLDPTGRLLPGAVACPPEGDAGTGMVATNAVRPRTGNISAGTSIFGMVVLDGLLGSPHAEIDIVATPSGDPVAMVHCNNGANELGAWANMFQRFSAAAGVPLDNHAVYDALFHEALQGEADADGLLVYNFLAGEPVAGLDAGRPLVTRRTESTLTLANFIRSHLYGVFATLAIGMRTLHDEGVHVDRLSAHGGVFATGDVAQRFLASALRTRVSVLRNASEGGAWGIALLAEYTRSLAYRSLADYLDKTVFAAADASIVAPHEADAAGFEKYLEQFKHGLAIQHAAAATL